MVVPSKELSWLDPRAMRQKRALWIVWYWYLIDHILLLPLEIHIHGSVTAIGRVRIVLAVCRGVGCGNRFWFAEHLLIAGSLVLLVIEWSVWDNMLLQVVSESII